MILALILFLSIGIITLYFMITTKAEVPFYGWLIPIAFIAIPSLLLKDFIFSFFVSFTNPKNSYNYTSKNSNSIKYSKLFDFIDQETTIIVNNIRVEKTILMQILDSGEKFRAVKYLIETTNIDLLSAKIIIDKFMTEKNTHNQVENNHFEKLIDNAEIDKLLLEGKKLEAVQYVMKKAKIGMHTAKDYIDSKI